MLLHILPIFLYFVFNTNAIQETSFMKIKKFKKTLSRLSVLLNTMDDNEKLSQLEKDLIRKHLLDLYDMTLESANVSSESAPKETSSKSVYDEVFETPSVKEPIKIQEAEPVQEEELQQTYIDLEPSQSKKEGFVLDLVENQSSISSELASSKQVVEISDEHADILDYGSDSNELSDRLSERPISDLTKAMGINERMLTVNELFDGDNSAFKAALSALNGLDSYEAAKSYISTQLIEKYNWVSPKKRKKAKVFIKLVKRRFN